MAVREKVGIGPQARFVGMADEDGVGVVGTMVVVVGRIVGIEVNVERLVGKIDGVDVREEIIDKVEGEARTEDGETDVAGRIKETELSADVYVEIIPGTEDAAASGRLVEKTEGVDAAARSTVLLDKAELIDTVSGMEIMEAAPIVPIVLTVVTSCVTMVVPLWPGSGEGDMTTTTVEVTVETADSEPVLLMSGRGSEVTDAGRLVKELERTPRTGAEELTRNELENAEAWKAASVEVDTLVTITERSEVAVLLMVIDTLEDDDSEVARSDDKTVSIVAVLDSRDVLRAVANGTELVPSNVLEVTGLTARSVELGRSVEVTTMAESVGRMEADDSTSSTVELTSVGVDRIEELRSVATRVEAVPAEKKITVVLARGVVRGINVEDEGVTLAIGTPVGGLTDPLGNSEEETSDVKDVNWTIVVGTRFDGVGVDESSGSELVAGSIGTVETMLKVGVGSTSAVDMGVGMVVVTVMVT
jgi:hypothetical protein